MRPSYEELLTENSRVRELLQRITERYKSPEGTDVPEIMELIKGGEEAMRYEGCSLNCGHDTTIPPGAHKEGCRIYYSLAESSLSSQQVESRETFERDRCGQTGDDMRSPELLPTKEKE